MVPTYGDAREMVSTEMAPFSGEIDYCELWEQLPVCRKYFLSVSLLSLCTAAAQLTAAVFLRVCLRVFLLSFLKSPLYISLY